LLIEVEFEQVKTRCIHAVLNASSDGNTHAALAVQEWEVLAPEPQVLTPAASETAVQHCDLEVAG